MQLLEGGVDAVARWGLEGMDPDVVAGWGLEGSGHRCWMGIGRIWTSLLEVDAVARWMLEGSGGCWKRIQHGWNWKKIRRLLKLEEFRSTLLLIDPIDVVVGDWKGR